LISVDVVNRVAKSVLFCSNQSSCILTALVKLIG